MILDNSSFIMDFSIIWFATFAVLLVVEILTMGLTTIWFAVGALLSCIIALIGGDLYLQVIVFLCGSTLMLLTIRPAVRRKFNLRREKTNIESLIGVTGIVTETLDPELESGRVLVKGQDWAAISADHQEIEKNARITVKEIRGVKMVVTEQET